MPTTFTNQATLSYNNQSIPSNVVTGVLTEVLSVSKTAIPAANQNGDTITYAVQLVNSGTAALTGLTLTDNLGAYGRLSSKCNTEKDLKRGAPA